MGLLLRPWRRASPNKPLPSTGCFHCDSFLSHRPKAELGNKLLRTKLRRLRLPTGPQNLHRLDQSRWHDGRKIGVSQTSRLAQIGPGPPCRPLADGLSEEDLHNHNLAPVPRQVLAFARPTVPPRSFFPSSHSIGEIRLGPPHFTLLETAQAQPTGTMNPAIATSTRAEGVHSALCPLTNRAGSTSTGLPGQPRHPEAPHGRAARIDPASGPSQTG